VKFPGRLLRFRAEIGHKPTESLAKPHLQACADAQRIDWASALPLDTASDRKGRPMVRANYSIRDAVGAKP
jgi:hypothetical protein